MSVVVWRKGKEKQAEVSSCRTDKAGSLEVGRSWASGDSGEGPAWAEAEREHMRHVSAAATDQPGCTKGSHGGAPGGKGNKEVRRLGHKE